MLSEVRWNVRAAVLVKNIARAKMSFPITILQTKRTVISLEESTQREKRHSETQIAECGGTVNWNLSLLRTTWSVYRMTLHRQYPAQLENYKT